MSTAGKIDAETGSHLDGIPPDIENELRLVRAPSLGLGSRRFESCIPDTSKLQPHKKEARTISDFLTAGERPDINGN